jgi:uncharacterized repeat protein (TIGR01451 family)
MGDLSLRALCIIAAVLGMTAPAVAAAELESVLTMTATFDKPSYETGEQMTITVTVTNTGAEPVNANANLAGILPDAVQLELDPFVTGEPFTLAGGESVTHTLTGSAGNPDFTTATIYASLNDWTAAAIQELRFTVPVTPTFGDVSGVVYYDRNRNWTFDDGEGQRDVVLTWASELHETTRTVTTDGNGRYTLPDLLTGPYSVTGTGLGGLQVGRQRVTVGKSGVDGLLLRGTAPVSGLLASMEFTKDTYAKDEAPIVLVTLTNTGDLTLSRIVAACNKNGSTAGLSGRGAGWGALADAGMDIPPHSTVVLKATEPMPEGAHDSGYVTADCEFRYPEVESSFNPRAYAEALVPGQLGDLEGVVARGETFVAGVRVVLVPKDGCAVTADVTTAEDGTFAFRQVPVGRYRAYVFPPTGWHVTENPSPAEVVGPNFLFVVLEPGDRPLPTLPSCQPAANLLTTAPTPSTPAASVPRAAPVPALAHTGVNILAPGIAGLLALLAGAGAVFLARTAKEN